MGSLLSYAYPYQAWRVIPIMWVIVVLLVRLVAGPLAKKVMPTFVGNTDGFTSRVLWSLIVNVTILSILLSIIGSWVGMGEISLYPFENFLHIWPRNFGIAFWIEAFVAQPIARFVMKKIHSSQDGKAAVQA